MARSNLIKKSVPEETAGGVVFRRRDGELQLLMIQDIRDRWTIPKGHVEEGERLEETAIREIREETGLRKLKILDRLGKTNFRYRKHDKLIKMTMHVYLIQALGDTDDYEPESSEGIQDVQWFDFSEAMNKIEYDDVGKLLLIGSKKIRNAGY